MTAELITLGLFLTGLGICIFTGIQILWALLFGLVCFSLYTVSRGYSFKETGVMLAEGMGKVKNILIIFVLIGSLTSIWRTCGTIPFILYHAMGLINPRYFVLCTFLLCSMMSFLTAFGTVVLTSVLSCAVSCNQSLATILACQMCDELYPNKEELAAALENTVIVIAALIPWGIAGAVPVATIGAPMACMMYAFYLYLLPVWNLFTAFCHTKPKLPYSTAAVKNRT